MQTLNKILDTVSEQFKNNRRNFGHCTSSMWPYLLYLYSNYVKTKKVEL